MSVYVPLHDVCLLKPPPPKKTCFFPLYFIPLPPRDKHWDRVRPGRAGRGRAWQERVIRTGKRWGGGGGGGVVVKSVWVDIGLDKR